MIRWLPSVTGILLLIFLMSGVEAVLLKARMIKPNYKGKVIVHGYGVVSLIWAVAIYILLMVLFQQARWELPVWTLVIGLFGLLGLADDIWGDAESRGFKGHLRALVKQHRVTTGLIKAVGGIAVGVTAGLLLWRSSPIHAIAAGIEIALCANVFNLLDLRPGRAGAIFLVAAIALAATAHAAWPLWIAIIPAWAVWLRDSRAQVMMGDCGANLIGAALGLGIAAAANMTILLTVTVSLFLITLMCEKFSLSKVIDNNPILRRLDRLTGVRK